MARGAVVHVRFGACTERYGTAKRGAAGRLAAGH